MHGRTDAKNPAHIARAHPCVQRGLRGTVAPSDQKAAPQGDTRGGMKGAGKFMRLIVTTPAQMRGMLRYGQQGVW